MKPLFLSLALAGTCVVAVAAPSTVVNPTMPANAAGVAADVNGEKITVADLNRRLDARKASEPSLQTNSPAAQKALADMRGQMLDDLITIKLLSQEAKKRKIVTPAKDIDAAVAQIKGQFKTDAEFNAWLKESGVNQNDLRARLTDELAMDELTAQITSDVTVSGDDVSKYYRAHPDEFTTVPAVRARHILLAINPNASASDKDAVKKRAANLIKQLKGGADFVALAKANSDDQTNKDRGGELPVFERGMMVKPFEDAAFGAKVGDIVGPVETDFGFHIIKIDQVLPQRLVELKDIQDDPRVRYLILRDKKQGRFDAFVAGLKSKAKINKYN